MGNTICIYKMKVVLTSDTHTTQFVNTFTDLFNKSFLTDVTLVGDDRSRIEAHRLVLCAGSTLLKEFLVDNSHPHPLIYLKGIKQHHLDSIVQFLYNGETTISQDNLNEFLKVAKELEICGLNNSKEDGVSEKHDNSQLKEEDILEEEGDLNSDQDLDVSSNVTTSYGCTKCDFSGLTEESLMKHLVILHQSEE